MFFPPKSTTVVEEALDSESGKLSIVYKDTEAGQAKMRADLGKLGDKVPVAVDRHYDAPIDNVYKTKDLSRASVTVTKGSHGTTRVSIDLSRVQREAGMGMESEIQSIGMGSSRQVGLRDRASMRLSQAGPESGGTYELPPRGGAGTNLSSYRVADFEEPDNRK